MAGSSSERFFIRKTVYDGLRHIVSRGTSDLRKSEIKKPTHSGIKIS